MGDGGDLVMLMEVSQLKKLALLLRNNEEAQITQAVKSQNERVKYLHSVNHAYNHAVDLLDDGSATRDKYAAAAAGGGGEAKASIAEDVLEYVKYGLNISMQNVRNCCLRVDCIGKIRAHYDSLVADLAGLHADDVANLRRLAKDTAMFKECMFEHCNKLRSGSARAMSKAFSMMLKQEGIKFPDLVKRHKNKLGFEGEFEHLTDAQKLEVYNSIIEESGRAKMPVKEMVSTAAGVAVLLATAGLMVWDIFTAEHTVEAVLRNSLNALAEVGAFAVQVVVEGAVTEAVADLELGVFVVSMAGFVAGAVAGLLFVAVAGVLVDLIMGTGGNVAPPVTDLKFHTATMPDGMQLAYIISHRG